MKSLANALMLVAAIILMAVPASAEERTEATWRAWADGAKETYADSRLAVLKAADVRYLKAGETAYLSAAADGAMELSLEPSGADILSVAYDGEKAPLKRGAMAFDFAALMADGARYPVSDRFDLSGGPSQLKPGVMGMRVILFDQERDEAKAFNGSNWFDYNKDLIFKTKFIPLETMEEKVIQTERGLWKQYFLAGHVTVKAGDAAVDLPLYARTSDPEKISYLFVSFTDETTGKETYGVGRYLDFEDFGPFPPKKLTVDFNRAYNPYCARTPHYNCPLALTHVPAALLAGEKTP